MTLPAGYRFRGAPHFHHPDPLINQLQLGSGLDCIRGRYFARPPWRNLQAEEWQRLSGEPFLQEESKQLDSTLSILQLPVHLLNRWWMLLEQSAETLGKVPLPGFDGFMAQLSEFLAFKEIPLPVAVRGEVIVSRPQPVFQEKPNSELISRGMRSNIAPWTSWPWSGELKSPRLWGGFNLGDEATSFVLINLSCKQQELALQGRLLESTRPETVGQLAELFLKTFPDYQPVRLVLQPGQGCRLPNQGVILDHYIEGNCEAHMMLLIHDLGNGNES